jgi:hypothetical protein
MVKATPSAFACACRPRHGTAGSSWAAAEERTVRSSTRPLRLAQGYATIGTDGGHDNATNSVAAAGGTAAFGLDYQARVDFAYNAYDQVTQVGKALVEKFYQQAPKHSYFVGCSEGGREAMLMTQRFPAHYDGVVAGDPVLHIPLGPLNGLYTTKLFTGLAQRSGVTLANGDPALGKTYSGQSATLLACFRAYVRGPGCVRCAVGRCAGRRAWRRRHQPAWQRSRRLVAAPSARTRAMRADAQQPTRAACQCRP